MVCWGLCMSTPTTANQTPTAQKSHVPANRTATCVPRQGDTDGGYGAGCIAACD